jgi:hypothetical protein
MTSAKLTELALKPVVFRFAILFPVTLTAVESALSPERAVLKAVSNESLLFAYALSARAKRPLDPQSTLSTKSGRSNLLVFTAVLTIFWT